MVKTPKTDESIFAEALAKPSPDERAAFLERVCGADRVWRERIETLLRSHDEAGSFLKEPSDLGATSAEPPSTENPGTIIDRYKLLQQIGEGGFGTVYMAEQKEPIRRRVALKIIKPGMDTKEVIARFEAERQALALMDHPNIAKVLDAGTTGGEPGSVSSGRPYFVMELVKGVTLAEFSDKNQLSRWPPADRARTLGSSMPKSALAGRAFGIAAKREFRCRGPHETGLFLMHTEQRAHPGLERLIVVTGLP
jgi:hypothetical protein